MSKKSKVSVIPVSVCVSSVSVVLIIAAIFSSMGNISLNKKEELPAKTEVVEQTELAVQEKISKTGNSKIIVLDPGHGVSSFSMSESEKDWCSGKRHWGNNFLSYIIKFISGRR